MSSIEFRQVSKRFPHAARPSVDEVSCAVGSGQFIVLLGPSGCGKTTLLKMVNRLHEPTGGEILIDGEDIRKSPVTALRQRIGYVIQQVGLFPHMTVAQNIAVVPTLLGWSKERIAPRIDELLTLIELPPAEYRQRYPSQLSGGQQQRVGLARALAGDPGVMLMDEPFGAIDAITRASLQDEMLRLQRQLKKTILFVTHDVEEALRLADRIIVMQQGKIVQYDTPLNLLTRPANQFVAELIGADDMLRQLGLLRVELAMAALPPDHHRNGEPTIGRHDDLRNALSLLLRTGAPALTVLEDEAAVGQVSLEDIRSLTSQGEAA
ncbi:MAG TPA: ABC transporter ATP-binding protein [Herpetosiphonaceae bacterium]